jgi:hypothetical protein
MSIKRIIAGTYLGKLYIADRLLFLIVFTFFFCSVLANIIKLEVTPFFVWDLYAWKFKPVSEYTLSEVHYNDSGLVSIPHTWNEPRKMMLFDPLNFYMGVHVTKTRTDWERDYLENSWGPKHARFKPILPYLYNQPAQFDAFPAWYKDYLSRQVSDTIRSIYILLKKVRYTATGSVEHFQSDTVMVIR